MDIKTLREIGRVLIKEIKPQALREFISIGAGGDKTYAIDKRAEEIVIESLKKTKEPLSIISEEVGIVELNGGGRKVLIDPIDGSRNAISGIPFFSTSIAVVEGSRIEDIKLSYIINLINGDEFWAVRGKGSYLNNIRVHTSTEEALRICAYEAQVPARDIPRILPLLSKFHRTRCLGSTALDLAYLSAGSISVFVSPAPSRSFDFAGGLLLVIEAGGVFTDIDGRDIGKIEVGLGHSTTLLASANSALHRRAIELLSRA